MKALLLFGLFAKDIIPQNLFVQGTVTDVKTWYFIKINKKPLRTGPLDGAAFPHRIVFEYEVQGKTYSGSKVLSPETAVPSVGEKITVFYDEKSPKRYAVQIGRR